MEQTINRGKDWKITWAELERKKAKYSLDVSMVQDSFANAPEHSHDFYEMALIVRGTGLYQSTSGTFQLKRGDVFLLPPGQKHSYNDQHHLKVFNLMVEKEEIFKQMPEIYNHPAWQVFSNLEPRVREGGNFDQHLTLDESTCDQAGKIIEEMFCELLQVDDCCQTMLYALLNQLMVLICRSYSTFNRQKNMLYPLAEILAYMQKNFNRKLTRGELAKIGNMSEISFFRHFVEAMGESPSQYLGRIRMKHAEKLLRTTDMRLRDIADECGFQDTNYFSTCFKKVYQIPPYQFRKLVSES